MQKVYMIITDCGDGSNSPQWTTDEAVVEHMNTLADEGDERYSSGDGLQVTELKFPDDFNLLNWLEVNHLYLTVLEDFED